MAPSTRPCPSHWWSASPRRHRGCAAQLDSTSFSKHQNGSASIRGGSDALPDFDGGADNGEKIVAESCHARASRPAACGRVLLVPVDVARDRECPVNSAGDG